MKSSLLVFVVLSFMLHDQARADPGIMVIVDVLEKPQVYLTDRGQTRRKYEPSNEILRCVYEPWAKFHYRIKRTFLLQGAKAAELQKELGRSIVDKSPTGWRGHEAEYSFTVVDEASDPVLRVSLSFESGSIVVVQDNRPAICSVLSPLKVKELLSVGE